MCTNVRKRWFAEFNTHPFSNELKERSDKCIKCAPSFWSIITDVFIEDEGTNPSDEIKMVEMKASSFPVFCVEL